MNEEALSVWLDDVLVGHIVRHAANSCTFQATTSYRSLSPRPILGQKFEDQDPGRPHFSPAPVPDWFAHLLPEPGGFLRDIVERQSGGERMDDFALLRLVGTDLPGAVIVRPASIPVAHDVAEAAADPGAEAGHIAFGLAGLQAKFSMSRGKDRSLVMRGSRGAEAWIVKTPDAVYPGVAENEYFVSRWARAAGIDVPDVNLVPSTDLVGLPPHVPLHDKLAFAIRRFDREDHARIHQEDFAQVIGRPLGHGGKYTGTSFDALAHVVLVHCGMADWEQYIRRLVFMVACGNADAHLKNWSLRYLNGVDARLSPAYDLLSTVVYPGHEHEAMALLLNKHSGFTQVSDRSWCRIARLCGMDERQVERQARTSAGAVRAAWRSTVDALAASLALPDRFVERVEKHMARIPLLRGV